MEELNKAWLVFKEGFDSHDDLGYIPNINGVQDDDLLIAICLTAEMVIDS